MSRRPDSLQQRAVEAGLQVHWTDVAGVRREAAADVIEAVLARLAPAADDARAAPPLLTTRCGQALRIAGAMPGPACWVPAQGPALPALADADGGCQAPAHPGYWTWQQAGRTQAVAVAPAQAWFPGADGERPWGLAAQVYSLRSDSDGGIGDSAGAIAWLDRVRGYGAAALALSPIHAGMPVRRHYSPYSPSDRRWLEALHGSAPQVLPQAAAAVRAQDPALDQRLYQHEAAGCIDWVDAAAAKWQWMERLPGWLQQHQPQRWEQIEVAMAGYGAAFTAWATQAAQVSQRPVALERFGQWLAQASWQGAQQHAREAGMQIGLIADLAVGFDPAGVEATDNRSAVMQGLELGAPPDAFNPNGQAWGITGYSPSALRAQGYAPFITLLRAVMRHRGGVRIDHILGLLRLWVLPQGAGAGQGVYLTYPFDDLLNLLVLESWQHRCMVIGEDLGMVPPGIRNALAERGVLGMDVLAFSRDAQGFWAPSRWRREAVAMTSTHDLPPLAGWLRGRDLQWRVTLGWTAERDAAAARQQRGQEVAQLSARLQAEQLDSGDLHADALALTARSPARLALLPLEDALALEQQPNLPGTVDQHPNWRQRLPAQLDGPLLQARLRAFATQRSTTGALP